MRGRLLGFASLAICLLSCSGDDFTSGSGGTSGASGSGGAATGGTAGAAGVGGSSGSAGDGGSGGDGGTAGSGGTGGSAGGITCGSWCGLAATCEDGVCVLANAQSGPENIVADDTHVFWTDNSQVRAVAKDGASLELNLIEVTGANFEFIDIDAGNVYVTDSVNGTLSRAAKTSGGIVIPLIENLTKAAGVAVDQDHAYVVDESAGSLLRVSKTAASTQIPEQFISGQSSPEAVAVDATNVYWTATDGVWTCPKGPSCAGATKLSSSPLPDATPHIKLGLARVFWTTPGGVAAVDKKGGATFPLATGLSGVEGLFIGLQHVYFCSNSLNAVYRVPLAGGAPETVAADQPVARGVTLDAEFVYWLTYETSQTGTVRKAPIPP